MAQIESMILCDTNIIIEAFKGNSATINELENIGLENIALSVITEMELYFGALNKRELKEIKKHLKSLQVLHINPEISQASVDLIEKYSKSHRLQIPDAIIAATSMVNKVELLTYNIKDFKYIQGLRLYQ